MNFWKRDPKVPLSAVQAIVDATVAAMKAGGKIAFEQTYPHREGEDDGGPLVLAPEDQEFVNQGAAPPAYEEEEFDEEAADAEE